MLLDTNHSTQYMEASKAFEKRRPTTFYLGNYELGVNRGLYFSNASILQVLSSNYDFSFFPKSHAIHCR